MSFAPRRMKANPRRLSTPFAARKVKENIRHISDGWSDQRVSRGLQRSLFDGNDVQHHVTDIYEKTYGKAN